MTSPRLAAWFTALVCLTVPAVAGATASADSAVTITGVDGLLYGQAPAIVVGQEGDFYLGADLDFACTVGPRLDAALGRLAKLARVISRSGRKVVFTLAPNKSAVLPSRLPSPLPHGECDAAGLAAQARILRGYRNPDFLPLTPALTKSHHQVYWKTDQHWTTVGGAVFARELAGHLDPRLGRRQHYTYGTESRLGAISELLGNDVPETLEEASPADQVRVRTAKGGQDWAGYPEFTFDHAWDSSPRRRTWPGHTLILGDSFGWYALENLRPVFRHGHFLWIGHTGTTDVAQEIRKSDTVVIELLELFATLDPIMEKGFRTQVRHALRRAPDTEAANHLKQTPAAMARR